jgi:O-antigen ligase
MGDDTARRSIRQGWRDGSISFPVLAALIIVMVVVGLGGASIGGAFGLIVILAVLISMVVLLVRWSNAPR